MTNNAAYFNSALQLALHSTWASGDSWTTAEIDAIVAWAILGLYPRHSRALDPALTTITVLQDVGVYGLPDGVLAVSRVDRWVGGVDTGPVFGGAWELTGDVQADSGNLHIGLGVVQVGDILYLHGYGRYDAVTNLVPDSLVPLVLARARAEAYRRVAADREKFKAWLVRNQTQSTSINELLQFMSDADADARRLDALTPRVWQKPVRGRVG